MAIVRNLELVQLQIETAHSETNATYCFVKDREGEVFLQLDTYGSTDRQMLGKKSQSIRFSREALKQLMQIVSKIPAD